MPTNVQTFIAAISSSKLSADSTADSIPECSAYSKAYPSALISTDQNSFFTAIEATFFASIEAT